MVKYRENRKNIIQSVEIYLTEIPDQSRQNIESKITYLNYISAEYKKIFKFEGEKKYSGANKISSNQ